MLYQSDHIKHLYIVKNEEFLYNLQAEKEVHQIVDSSEDGDVSQSNANVVSSN